MPGPTKFRQGNLVSEALKRGDITKHQITDSATRVMQLLQKTGRIGQPGFPPPSKAEEPHYQDNIKSRNLLRQAAEASMVLLRNQAKTLPLSNLDTKLAVIGRHASEPSLFGGGSASIKVPYSSTPWDAIQKTYRNAAYSPGVAITRLIPLPDKSTIGIEDITLEWYNGDQPSVDKRFFSQTLKDPLYMVVEHAPEGLVDRSDFCTSMTLEFVPPHTGSYNMSLCGPGNATCLLDDQVVLHVSRDREVSTEDFLFDRSKLEVVREKPLVLEVGRRYKLQVLSWSSKHKAQNVNREFFIQGCRLGLSPTQDDDSALKESEELARTADAALVVVGTGVEWESEGFDRVSMQLPRRQDELVLRVAAACRGPTIVVVNSGSPIDTSRWIHRVDAVICAWFPGMEFGSALARVLTGEVSPCARLPTTFWDKVQDYPAGHVESLITHDRKIHYREGIYVGYRQPSLESYQPRFAFGHGLAYTTFHCSVKSPGRFTFDANQQSTATVVLTILNTGSMAASDAVLLFVEALEPTIERPTVELRAFAKTCELQPGASQDLRFHLKSRDFSYWDQKHHLWRVDPGLYRVRVAGPAGVGDWRDMDEIIIEVSSAILGT